MKKVIYNLITTAMLVGILYGGYRCCRMLHFYEEEPRLFYDANGTPIFFDPKVPVKFVNELNTVYNAAVRNNCTGDDFLILLAIRIAENGGPGKEFGVKHPKAWGTNLDTQAGWAAATIVKNRERFNQKIRDTPHYDRLTDEIFTPEQFVYFLGNRYCPVESDPQGNINWKRNVLYWYQKLGGNV